MSTWADVDAWIVRAALERFRAALEAERRARVTRAVLRLRKEAATRTVRQLVIGPVAEHDPRQLTIPGAR